LSLIYLLTLELSTSHQQLTNHQIEQEEFYWVWVPEDSAG
jgi:hypothetical protein